MTCCSATSRGPSCSTSSRQRQPSALILTMDNPVLVNRLTKQLRRRFPDLPIIARARDTAHAAQFYKAGVTDAVPETLEASLQLSEAVLVDLGVAMGPVIASDPREARRAPDGDQERGSDGGAAAARPAPGPRFRALASRPIVLGQTRTFRARASAPEAKSRFSGAIFIKV